MPKRHKLTDAHSPAERDQKWTIEEWTSILAWLDNCLVPRRRKVAFQDTVEKHFQSKWPDRETSQKRILRKVKWIWDEKAHDGPIGKDRWKEILSRGSKCLNIKSFNWEEKVAFSNARVELRLPALAEVEGGELDELAKSDGTKLMEKKKTTLVISNMKICENGVKGLKRKAQVIHC